MVSRNHSKKEFKKAIDASTLETLINQEYITKNDVAELTLKTRSPVAFDLFGSIATTGRFVLVDEYDVCGGGIITTYTPSKSDRLRDEVRHRDFHWLKSDIKLEEMSSSKRRIALDKKQRLEQAHQFLDDLLNK